MREIINPQPKQNLETAIIKHERYVLAKVLGEGCWGTVYDADDVKLNKKVAIKVFSPNELALQQAMYRNLDTFKAMVKEEAELKACSNIVPRRLEFDEQGKPFIVMPKYEQFLSDILQDNSQRNHLKQGLSIDKIISYACDIANGVLEMHTKLRRVHGDIKADNVALDEHGIALLNDLGTSTFASYGQSTSPRDNLGFVLTRAPECFLKGSRPTKQSDIWSFGSLLYRMFTGEYVFEKELEKNPNHYVDEIMIHKALGWTPRIIEKVDHSKKIPKAFKKLLKKCLDYPDYRIKDAHELSHLLNKAIRKYEKSRPKQRAIRYSVWTLVGASALAMLVGFIARHNETLKLNQELIRAEDQKERVASYERKARVIRLFEDKVTWEGSFESEGKWELKYWVEKIKQDTKVPEKYVKKIAFVAYLDPETTYALIQELGDKIDENSFSTYLARNNRDLFMAFEHLKNYAPGHHHLIDHESNVNLKWEKAKEKYNAAHPGPPFPIIGPDLNKIPPFPGYGGGNWKKKQK